jgi:sugar phosphate isomerase/epimerase
MRLGIAGGLSFRTPEEWAEKQRKLQCSAVILPLNYTADDKIIETYLQVCKDYDLLIAEVGAWCNPLSADKAEREKNVAYIKNQLKFADRIGARCCVNIAGSKGTQWDGGYVENYSEETYNEVVEMLRDIIDDVNPQNTYYALEPMPWMIPDSPENYVKLINDVERDRFAAHLDAVNMISTPERYFFNDKFIIKCFELMGKHIRCCHVKDIRLEGFLTFNLKETYCGNGNFNHLVYAQYADKSDADMPFLIEHLATEDEYVRAVNYIKDVIKDTDIVLK